MHVIQENKDILGDGYEGDVLGESTPDVIVSEFVSILSNILINFNLFISSNFHVVMHLNFTCILHVILEIDILREH